MRVYGLMVAMAILLGHSAWSQEEAKQGQGSLADERLQIDNFRRQKTAEFDQQDAACFSKFAVTACQSKVSAMRREMLSELKRQESALNQRERQQKGAEQQQRSAAKAIEAEQRKGDAQSARDSASPDERNKSLDEKVLNHQLKATQRVTRPPVSKATSSLDAGAIESNRKAYLEKRNAAEKRRQDRDKRLLDHGVGGQPLPVPP